MKPTTQTDIEHQLNDIQSLSFSMSALSRAAADQATGHLHHTLNLLAAGSELISDKSAAARQSLGDAA